MKSNEIIETLETIVIDKLEDVKKRPSGSSKNREDYYKDARLAIGILGNYVRLRATIANEETNRLVSIRIEQTLPVRKRLKS